MPLEAWGKTGEALGTCAAGDLVAVSGKLAWRKGKTADEKGTLVVMVQKVSVLAPASVAVE